MFTDTIAQQQENSDKEALDLAIAALQTYNYGSSRALLLPIDDAVRACLEDAAARKALERRLAAVLRAKASPVAKEYVCGKLGLIGSAESAPALAELLGDKDLAHAARSALESMPCAEAVKALRDSLPKLGGLQLVGVINSLGMRRDSQSVPALAALLEESDSQVAGAAAAALGNIGTAESAQALLKSRPKSTEAIRLALAEACLVGAERLLSDGKRAEALAMYKALTNPQQPRQIQLAAKRGLAMAGLKQGD
jgi:HEAT repeat protein